MCFNNLEMTFTVFILISVPCEACKTRAEARRNNDSSELQVGITTPTFVCADVYISALF